MDEESSAPMLTTFEDIFPELTLSHIPRGETMVGLTNLGNTCYLNATLQTLYYCPQFRREMISYYDARKNNPAFFETLAFAVGELFNKMQSFPLPIGEINPDGFIEKLKQNTDIFESGVQQDAAEFLGFLLDNIHESLKSEDLASRKVHQQSTSNTSEHNLFAFHTSPSTHPAKATIVQKTFMGELAVRHKCDRCESITTTQEEFITLPVPITHGASVTNCLNKLSKKETLSGSDNKFYCNICRSKQEAQRNSRLASPPKMLLLHFVRFKMVRSYFHKDSSRVTIPFHMRPQHFGMCDELFDKSNPLSQHHVDPRYSLTGIIVHIGGSPKSGHYIAIVQSHGQWFLINDKVLHPIKRTDISLFFGIPNPGPATPETLPSNKAMQALMSQYPDNYSSMNVEYACRGTAYVLFYSLQQ